MADAGRGFVMSRCPNSLVMISYLDYPFYAGLSVRMTGLIGVLQRCGIQVRVLAPIFRLDRPLQNESTCEIEYIDLRWLRRLGPEKPLVKLLADAIFSLIVFARVSPYLSKRSSVVQYQSLYSAMPAILMKLFWRSKVIGDDIVLHLSENRWMYPLSFFANHVILKLTDVVVTASEYAYSHAQSMFPKKNVIRVPNGVQLQQRSFEDDRKFSGSEMIFVGSLCFDQNLKAVADIIQIASDLDSRKLEFRILIVGGPTYYIWNLLDHPMVKSGRVSFLGPLSRERLRELYCSSFVGLLPFFENTPLIGGQRTKALEYFANGLVVVSGSQGVRGIEGLIAGEHYLLGKSVDEMVEVIEDIISCPDRFTGYAEQGYDLIKQYSWEHVARNYARIVKDKLAETR